MEDISDIYNEIYLKVEKILDLISSHEQKEEYVDISYDILELHNQILLHESKLEMEFFEPFYSNSIFYMLKESKNRKNSLPLLIYSLNLYHNSLDIIYCLYKFLYLWGDKVFDSINVLRFILNEIESGSKENISYVASKKTEDIEQINFLLATLYFEIGDYGNFEYQISLIKDLKKFIEEYKKLNPFPFNTYRSRVTELETNVAEDLISPLKHFKLGREYLRELQYDKGLEEMLISLKRSFEEDNIILQKNIFSELLLKAKEIGIDGETLSEIIQEGNSICNDFPYFWYCLGIFYFKTGNLSEAIINFETALEKDKNLKENISFIEKENVNRIDYLTSETYNPYHEKIIITSLDLAKEILTFTLHPSLFTQIGELYKNKEYTKALKILQEINKESLNNYEKYVLYDYLALIYERENDLNNAEKALCKAICGLNYEELIIRKKMIYERKFAGLYEKIFAEFEMYQIPYEWQNCLKEIEKIKPSTVLEIGSFKGGTMISLARFCSDDALLISVDWPDGGYKNVPVTDKDLDKFKSVIKMNKTNQKLHILSENSHNPSTKDKICEILDGKKLDLLFIDGDHSYEGVKNDYEMYSEFVSENGVILFHDTQEVISNQKSEVAKLWKQIMPKNTTKELIYSKTQTWAGIGIIYKRKPDKKIYEKFNFVSLYLNNSPVTKESDNCISLFKNCFDEIGIKYSHTFNKFLPEHNNIIFYPFSTPDLSNYAMDFTYIVVQLEPIAETKFEGEEKTSYIRLLKNAFNVWDYSEENINYLNSIGLDNLYYLPYLSLKNKMTDKLKEALINLQFTIDNGGFC